ncbi:MAG: S46 family peptidase [Bacteroidales bacterium]|jgi:hypothetical protein
MTRFQKHTHDAPHGAPDQIRRTTLALLALFLLFQPIAIQADEGMWLPMLIGQKIERMQELGFKLTAEDIYSINKASLKDAIVHFGGGCTGEVISAEGLLLTNHHCGYGQIQAHSSVENDYLKDGFWARTRAEELPNKGLTVTFMRRMEDVTDQVLTGIKDNMDEAKRQEIIAKNIKKLTDKTLKGLDKNFYSVTINPTYYGNQYFLYFNEIFRDVRLVGAPPSSIGKFGGDTDNWIWPRHTGDFALFRIYADKDNNPAEYSPDNVPYTPKYHFTISNKGVQEGDFTMVYGYPGRTQQYVLSPAVEYLALRSNPMKIHLRTLRLEVMNREQAKDPSVRIRYASKNANVSNAWKKWQGESRGIINAGTIAKKQAFEERFTKWAKASGNPEYTTLIPRIKALYESLEPLQFASEMYAEAIMAVELLRFADNLATQVARRGPEAAIPLAESFFKDYYLPIDKEIFEILFTEFYKAMHHSTELLPDNLIPTVSSEVSSAKGLPLLPMHRPPAEYFRDAPESAAASASALKDKTILEAEATHREGHTHAHGHHSPLDFAALAEHLYTTSALTDKEKTLEILFKDKEQALELIYQDIAYRLVAPFVQKNRTGIQPKIKEINDQLNLLYRSWMQAIMEFDKDRIFYPDANSTLRVAFGTVSGYSPKDAVVYKPVSTIEGIMEKDNPDVFDYNIPQELRDIYANRDFGPWETDGSVAVCFIATNHTSGGNSGSPVLNANGHLLGLNFDRVWEGTMSDIEFDPSVCRNISVDIRYVLFLIDKIGKADYLFKELDISQD